MLEQSAKEIYIISFSKKYLKLIQQLKPGLPLELNWISTFVARTNIENH